MSGTTINISGNSNDSNLFLGSSGASIRESASNVQDKPMPEKYFNATNLAAMQKIIDDAVDGDNLRNCQVCVGNFKTKEDYHLVSGKQADGSDLTTDNYMRWASMSKLLGGLVLTLALQKGIIPSIDEPIKNADPNFAKENFQVLVVTQDASGYDVVTGLEPCKTDITYRHLITMSSGFPYAFFIGTFFSGLGNTICRREQYIKENYPDLWPQLDIQAATNGYSTNNYLNIINQVPLLFQPGTDYRYGTDYDILGAMLSKVLALKGLYNGSSVDMFLQEIAHPIGATKTWFRSGHSSAPVDAAEKLTSVSWVVPEDYDESWGNNSNSAGMGNVWADDYPNDDLYKLTQTINLKPRDTSVIAGCFGGGINGPFSDYVKFMKLIYNNGYHEESGKQIISPQFMSWNTERKTPDDKPVKLLGGALTFWNGGWGNGFRRGNAEPDEYAPFGLRSTPIGFTNDTMYWVGWWGVNFQFDLKTGFYCVYGLQTPLNFRTFVRDDTIFTQLSAHFTN